MKYLLAIPNRPVATFSTEKHLTTMARHLTKYDSIELIGDDAVVLYRSGMVVGAMRKVGCTVGCVGKSGTLSVMSAQAEQRSA